MTFLESDIYKIVEKYQVNEEIAKKILSQQKVKELIKHLPDDDRYKQILQLIIDII